MRVITYFVLFIIILLGITFATLNPLPVKLNYYIGQTTLPLSLLLVWVFAIGCLLGLLIGLLLLVRVKVKNYRLRQRLKVAEKEVQNLRAIPLQDKH